MKRGMQIIFMIACCMFTSVSQAEESNKISLVDLRDVKLHEATRLLSEVANLNIVASSEAGKVKVSLFVKDMEAVSILRNLCHTHGLRLSLDAASKTWQIQTFREFKEQSKIMGQGDVEVFTLRYPNVLDVAIAIRDLYGERVMLSEGIDSENETEELESRLERFEVLESRGQTQNFLGGSNGSGGNSNNNDNNNRRNNNNDNNSNNDNNQSGSGQSSQGRTGEGVTVHISLIKRHNKMIVRTGNADIMRQIENLIKELDVPTPLVLLEVKVLAIELSDGDNSIFEFQYSDENKIAGGFSLGDILSPASDNTANRGSQSLTPGGSGLRTGDLLFQFVNNDFRARMQFLRSENRLTTLATPFLLTANNEVSRLFQGKRVPINTGNFTGSQTTLTSGGSSSGGGSAEVQLEPVGTTLMITPNINADRTVTLRLLQETSSISPVQATVLVPQGSGFTSQSIDVVQAQSISGTVVAKDGHAIAVGGLIDESISDSEAKMPVLGDIPLLGKLFSRESSSKTRTELVVMIRPFVLNTPSESAAVSRRLLEELSIHPTASKGSGTLNTFDETDVKKIRKRRELIDVFDFHSIPKVRK